MKKAQLALILGLCATLAASLPALVLPDAPEDKPSTALKLLLSQNHVTQGHVNDSAACPLCEVVARSVLNALKDPSTQLELVSEAKQACALLPDPTLVTQCDEDVDKYSEEIFQILAAQDPTEWCTSMGVCGADTSVPPTPLQRLARDWLALQGGLSDDNCQACQMVQAEAVQALADPKTQQQVLEYAKEACEQLGAFADQCESTVAIYGPLAISMAASYIADPKLCASLGFCPGSPSASTTPLAAH